MIARATPLAEVAESLGERSNAWPPAWCRRSTRLVTEIGIRIANKRIAVTPFRWSPKAQVAILRRLPRQSTRRLLRSALIFSVATQPWFTKGATRLESEFIDSIPTALSLTARLCASVNVATTRAGINMDAVAQVGRMLKEAAERTRDQGGLACAKFVCFANAVEDNPFMAGAFHGIGEAETIINVGVSGPGVVNHALRHAPQISRCTNWPKPSRTFL